MSLAGNCEFYEQIEKGHLEKRLNVADIVENVIDKNFCSNFTYYFKLVEI